MRTERERGIQRNSAFLKAQYIYFTIRDGYISNPTDYTVTWEAYTGSDGDLDSITLTETRDGTAQKNDTFIKTNSSED